MKKILSIAALVVVMIGSTQVFGFNATLNSDEMNVKAVSSKDVFAVGDNTVTVELTDSNGNFIGDAEITVYFYMPSMPAMNYEVASERFGKKYSAVVKPTMPGKWTADINVRRADKLKTLTVDFDAK